MKTKFKHTLRFNKIHIMLIIGVLILLTFCVFSMFPSKVAPYSPNKMFEPYLKCSTTHILGTNNLGRDIFSEMVFATSSTLTIGLLAALITLALGTLIGLFAGYLKGVWGEIVNGFINFFLLIPMLPLAIVISAYLGAGQQNIILTISILAWCSTARAVRAKTMKLKEMPFIQSLKNLGLSKIQIMFRHVLPNLKDVIFAKYIMSVASCILIEAALSFLGLGDVSKVTWGSMINLAFKHGGFSMGVYNWFLAPGICIMLLVLSFYCIGYYIENHGKQINTNRSYMD